jgi:hypothetical protein
VCSLSAADAGTRQAEWSALLARAAVTRTPVAGGMRVGLAPVAGVRSELERLVEAERACCPFLELALEETTAGLVLTVTAPPDAEPIVQELLA